MKFRIARHTNNLTPIISFYKDLLGLSILGNFKDHEGYDGIFLRLNGADWHLEFTISNEKPVHKPDKDDLLVFYLPSIAEYELLKKRFDSNGITEVEAKNPYWKSNGATYVDPDGYRIVLSIAK